MSPQEFKSRFQNAYGEIPEGIDIELGTFREFPKKMVESLKISDEDKSILLEVGFPEQSAPFLDFTYNLERLTELQPNVGKEYDRFRVIGHNGSGDLVCIDESDGSICYHIHDNRMARVFINSSLHQFAESLCLIVETIESDFSKDFLALLSQIDSRACESGTFWPMESQMLRD